MSKITFLDSIDVESPCSESWDEMQGNDQSRFCSHCAKDVHNLSEMTRKKARKIVAASDGGICVRYIRRPDSRIQTLKNTLHQITRQTGLAAGVLGASLSASSIAYAQTIPEPSEPVSTQIVNNVINEKSDSPSATLSGTITDPNGAVVPFAFVTLTNEQTNFYQTTNANQDGFYEFKDVPVGDYKLKVDAGGFASKEISQVSVSSVEQNYDAQLSVETMQEVVTVSGTDTNNVTFLGGMIGSVSTTYRYNRLVMAVENDNLEEVKVRVMMGERVNAKDKGYDGNSPLHVAVENGNLEITQFLLTHGAKTNSKNAEKRTPLMMLDEDASVELVNLLLNYGAKINLADKEGNTALMFAAEYAPNEVVQSLISASATVNAVNKQGETALMRAAKNGELENVKSLLGAGANVQIVNKERETILSMTDNQEVKQLLIAYGATE
jgi:hypothetical protein